MDYGINIAPAADAWKVVRRAEELGFTHAWFFDTQMQNADVFVAMAAAAMQTEKIKLVTGVLIPPNRIAPVAANALASLNALAPGRIQCGIGTGFTGRRAMGLGAIRLAEAEDYIRVLRGLLANETVEWDYEGARRKIRFLNPELGEINTADPIDFHLSAFGPKGRRLAAKLGTGWLIPIRTDAVVIDQLADMREAWTAAGRAPAELYATAQAGGCILAEGEPFDSERAIAQAGPNAAMVLHDLAEADAHGSLGIAVPPLLRPAVEAYREIYRAYEPADARYLSVHKGHLMVVRPEERPLITADLIRALSFTGTAGALRERIRGLRDAGFSQLSTHIRYGQPQMVEEWADLLATV